MTCKPLRVHPQQNRRQNSSTRFTVTQTQHYHHTTLRNLAPVGNKVAVRRGSKAGDPQPMQALVVATVVGEAGKPTLLREDKAESSGAEVVVVDKPPSYAKPSLLPGARGAQTDTRNTTPGVGSSFTRGSLRRPKQAERSPARISAELCAMPLRTRALLPCEVACSI